MQKLRVDSIYALSVYSHVRLRTEIMHKET